MARQRDHTQSMAYSSHHPFGPEAAATARTWMLTRCAHGFLQAHASYELSHTSHLAGTESPTGIHPKVANLA
eukprot:2442898-Amphidinium_carterae.1